jgi:putative sugar O-methyltransferase
MNQSSISDTQKYKNACALASQSDFHFSFFKQDPAYTEILEHVSQEQGELYKKYIDLYFPEYKHKIDKFKENDLYGNPSTFFYSEIGSISPTTLRYIKVLSDLKNLYQSLDNFNVVEIGVGYGGQCKVITDFFNIGKYYLVDLDEASNLASKYLSRLNVNNAEVIRFQDLPKTNFNFDLIISNYAFTEIDKNIQDIYIEKILKKSKHGYITCNFTSHFYNIDSYSLHQLESKLIEFNTKRAAEYPLTHKDNLILYW